MNTRWTFIHPSLNHFFSSFGLNPNLFKRLLLCKCIFIVVVNSAAVRLSYACMSMCAIVSLSYLLDVSLYCNARIYKLNSWAHVHTSLVPLDANFSIGKILYIYMLERLFSIFNKEKGETLPVRLTSKESLNAAMESLPNVFWLTIPPVYSGIIALPL